VAGQPDLEKLWYLYAKKMREENDCLNGIILGYANGLTGSRGGEKTLTDAQKPVQVRDMISQQKKEHSDNIGVNRSWPLSVDGLTPLKIRTRRILGEEHTEKPAYVAFPQFGRKKKDSKGATATIRKDGGEVVGQATLYREKKILSYVYLQQRWRGGKAKGGTKIGFKTLERGKKKCTKKKGGK